MATHEPSCATPERRISDPASSATIRARHAGFTSQPAQTAQLRVCAESGKLPSGLKPNSHAPSQAQHRPHMGTFHSVRGHHGIHHAARRHRTVEGMHCGRQGSSRQGKAERLTALLRKLSRRPQRHISPRTPEPEATIAACSGARRQHTATWPLSSARARSQPAQNAAPEEKPQELTPLISSQRAPAEQAPIARRLPRPTDFAHATPEPARQASPKTPGSFHNRPASTSAIRRPTPGLGPASE